VDGAASIGGFLVQKGDGGTRKSLKKERISSLTGHTKSNIVVAVVAVAAAFFINESMAVSAIIIISIGASRAIKY
jgi:hypothetical protein